MVNAAIVNENIRNGQAGLPIWDCGFRIADFDVGNILTAGMKLVLLSIILLTASSAFGQCPTITVIGPQGVTNVGDKMTFRVEVGTVGAKLTYQWSVSAGTIVEGQGTKEIGVAIDGSLEGSSVTATVTVEGIPQQCVKTGSESAPVNFRLGCGAPTDEWGKLKPNEERSRLDTVFAEFANNPTQTGFLLLYITDKERLDSGNARVQFVLKHARFRKFDSSRIVFGLEISDEARTKVFRIPRGSDLPCTECVVVRDAALQ